MWSRDLDLLVPLWQGADDIRVRDGADGLDALTTPAARRVVVPVPPDGSARADGVLSRDAVHAALAAQRRALEIHDPARVLTLGGDCTVEVASIAHLAGRYGRRLFVLWIDAHGDLNTPATSPSGTAHGMPLRLLLEARSAGPLPAPGCLTPTQVALVGVRDLDPDESTYVEDYGLSRLSVSGIEGDPDRLAALPPPGAAVYVHLDLDVIDPYALPAVAVPTADGVSVDALAQALRTVRSSHEVVGIGITEYVPQVPHDPSVLTRITGALGLSGQG
jgi:arginase